MTMTEKTTTKATDSAETPAGPFPVGTLVKIPHGERTNYAVVVGYSDPVEEDKAAFLEEAAEEAAGAIAKGSQEEEVLRERVRLAVRRTATRWTGKKPVVDVLLIRA